MHVDGTSARQIQTGITNVHAFNPLISDRIWLRCMSSGNRIVNCAQAMMQGEDGIQFRHGG